MGFLNWCNFALSASLVCSSLVVFPALRLAFWTCSSLVAIVWLSENLMTVTRKHFLHRKVSSEGKAVFITGCDSGFGHSLANRLDKLGYTVFAGCLDRQGDGAKTLLETCSPSTQVLPLDVTSEDSVQAAKKYIENNLKNDVLWAVVNNAGIALGGEIEWSPMSDLRRIYDVNTTGTLRVSKAFISLLRKSKGRLINNTSACGEFTCPGFVGYCMSKSASIALSTGLRVEMKKWGVRVISIQPFFYKTPLTHEEVAEKNIRRMWSKADPQIRVDYGDSYVENFIECCRLLLQRGSARIGDVVDCFEDAITSADPLDTYFPASLLDKLGIKFLRLFPAVVTESYQSCHLPSVSAGLTSPIEGGSHPKTE